MGEEDTPRYVIRDIGGGTYLIIGGSVTLMEKPYTVYVVRDISTIYSDSPEPSLPFSWAYAAPVLRRPWRLSYSSPAWP